MLQKDFKISYNKVHIGIIITSSKEAEKMSGDQSKEAQQIHEAEQKFDRTRRLVGLIGAPILAILVLLTPIEGLTLASH